MYLTKQIDKEKSKPIQFASLVKAIRNREGGSMFQRIGVHCFELAQVLDRLTYLEKYYKETQALFRTYREE